MKIKFEIKKIKDVKAEAVASFVFEDMLDSKLHWLNTLYKGGLETLIESSDFKGKTNDVITTYTDKDSRSKRLMLKGLGNSKEITLEKLRKAYAQAAKAANKLKLSTVGFEIPDLSLIKSVVNYSIADITQAICEAIILSQYEYKKYVSKNNNSKIEEVVLFTDSPKHTREINETMKETKMICDAVYLTRDIGNEPSNILTPDSFADLVKKASTKAGYSVTIYDEKKIKQMGMGGITAVGQGSDNPARFLILQYFGSTKSEKPVVLVGKGVTFDSGGISIKPAGNMDQMKMDMCGASAVVGTFEVIARLKPKLNLIGLIPSVENMPGGNAYKPGDIIKSYGGTTIEVLNTDAEGRLILADALEYAANYKPKAVIDLATLTGAALICFGHQCAGIMGNNKDLVKKLFDAGEKTYERLWELPLYDEYDALMKSEFADIKNIGPSRLAGTIMGGIFLKKFVKNSYPWVHLDIAGTAFVSEASEYISSYATGFGVRLLVDYLKNL